MKSRYHDRCEPDNNSRNPLKFALMRGRRGPVGPPGPGAIPVFGYIYNLGAQAVAAGADVVFSTNGVTTTGITHTPGTAPIQIANAGNYEVTFSVTANEANQFAIALDGVIQPLTVYGTGGLVQLNNGQAILTITAGQTLTLRNVTGAAVTLPATAGGTTPTVNASIIIRRLS